MLNSRGKRKLCPCLGVPCASVYTIAIEGYPGGSRPVSTEDWVLQELSVALAGVVRWIERRLQIKRLPVRFPFRTHVWVVGQAPGRGNVRSNHTLMFLSLSFSFPSPLSRNKF